MFSCIVRNLISSKGRPSSPTRTWRKNTEPDSRIRAASHTTANAGALSMTSSVAAATSNTRLLTSYARRARRGSWTKNGYRAQIFELELVRSKSAVVGDHPHPYPDRPAPPEQGVEIFDGGHRAVGDDLADVQIPNEVEEIDAPTHHVTLPRSDSTPDS